MKILRLWWAYFLLHLRDAATYRLEFLFRWIALPIELFLLFFLWQALAAAGHMVQFEVKGVISYYIAALFLNKIFPFVRMARDIREEIYSGDILIYYVRRVPYGLIWASRGVVAALIYIPVALPIATVLILLSGAQITVPGTIWFVVLGVIGYIITFQLWYLIGATTFFTEENIGAIRLYEIIQQFLGGLLIPLDFFPPWFQHISAYLPFQFWVYLPSKALVDTAFSEQAWQFALIGLGWIIALHLFTRLIWNRGWKLFSGNSV